MSLWKIAWRSIQQRALASALTGLSMALGVGLVVAVLVIHGVVNKSFRRSAQGYDIIVGAQGYDLQLVLSTVFHIGRPGNTIPYWIFDEISKGRYAPYIDVAVPICLGDTYKNFRVIGTTPDMFSERLEYQEGKKYEFSEGRVFDWEKHAEAVVGSAVARRIGLKVDSTFRPVHGDSASGDEHGEFTVVGIVAPTGTPIDRAIYVNIEGFFDLHAEKDRVENVGKAPDIAKGEAKTPAGDKAAGKDAPKVAAKPAHADAAKGDEAAGDHDHEEGGMPYDKKTVSAVLLALRDNVPEIQRVALPQVISQDFQVLAVRPTEAVTEFFEKIIGNIQRLLLVLAVLIVIVAGIGILVSIYNSMNDRRHEIAVMRALGARRTTVMAVIVLESILLALGGGVLGVLLGHGLTAAAGPTISHYVSVAVDPFQFQPAELILIPGLILLASAIGYLPAVVAYRTDVAQSLIASP
jgi:putative ABC transport system permease protein